jgi:hypothetical protein
MKFLFTLIILLLISNTTYAKTVEVNASLTAEEVFEINDSIIYLDNGVYQYIITNEQIELIYI